MPSSEPEDDDDNDNDDRRGASEVENGCARDLHSCEYFRLRRSSSSVSSSRSPPLVVEVAEEVRVRSRARRRSTPGVLVGQEWLVDPNDVVRPDGAGEQPPPPLPDDDDGGPGLPSSFCTCAVAGMVVVNNESDEALAPVSGNDRCTREEEGAGGPSVFSSSSALVRPAPSSSSVFSSPVGSSSGRGSRGMLCRD